MKKQLIFIFTLAFLSLSLTAQGQGDYSRRSRNKQVYTGFSGGMMIHGGYSFAESPEKVFSNTGLGTEEYVKGLPKAGFCFGLGGSLRVHLVDHVHIGAEGFVSMMPIMRTGSNIRTGWGGAFVDGYLTLDKVRPLLGLSIGGGSMNRLYVPDRLEGIFFSEDEGTFYNASYTKTPFFYIDPYIGLEVDLDTHMALIIRVDYVLPFGKSESELVQGIIEPWSTFMGPSGPRLYVGIMFGHFGNGKKN